MWRRARRCKDPIRMSLSDPGSNAPNAGDHAGPAAPDGGEEQPNALLMSEQLELEVRVMRALTLRPVQMSRVPDGADRRERGDELPRREGGSDRWMSTMIER